MYKINKNKLASPSLSEFDLYLTSFGELDAEEQNKKLRIYFRTVLVRCNFYIVGKHFFKLQ